MATQTEIGRHLDLSQGAVSQFLAEEGIERSKDGYDLDQVRLAYIRRLREKAAGRAGDDPKLNLAEERAKLASLQAESWSLKVDRAKEELLPRAEVTSAVTQAFGALRGKLLNIPARAAPLVAALQSPVESQELLTGLIHEALRELASTEIRYAAPGDEETAEDAGPPPRCRRRGGRLVAGSGATAEADGQRLGRRKPQAKP